MQKVSIIIAVIVVDIVVVVEFVISTAPSEAAYFGGWKNFFIL